MIDVIEVPTADDGAAAELFHTLSGPGGPDRATMERQAPRTMLVAVDHVGSAVARCSLWWDTSSPAQVGIIGHYAALDTRTGSALLDRASEVLRAHGCARALGPMDGTTWDRYRLLTQRGGEPAFFLEADNPDDWPAHFTGAGFEPVARFVSTLNRDMARTAAANGPELDPGVGLRPVDFDRFEDELCAVHEVVQDAFAAAPMFTPIGRSQFVARLQPLLPFLRPELVQIAERDGRPVGFVLGIPDLLNPGPAGGPDTVVLKTIAVRPEARGRKLGEVLARACYAGAVKLGYTRAIHALMRADNASRHLSGAVGSVFRRYALFGKEL